MKTSSSMLHVQMDTEMNRKATAELKVPNARTRRAMAESEEMMRRGTARFAREGEMFAALEEADLE